MAPFLPTYCHDGLSLLRVRVHGTRPPHFTLSTLFTRVTYVASPSLSPAKPAGECYLYSRILSLYLLSGVECQKVRGHQDWQHALGTATSLATTQIRQVRFF
jgi:hypothetical protein